MNCLLCETPLIIGGSHDIETDEGETIETNLSCPNCDAFVLVVHPMEKDDDVSL